MPSVAELYAKNYGHLFKEQYIARQVIEGNGKAVVSEPHLGIVCIHRTILGTNTCNNHQLVFYRLG